MTGTRCSHLSPVGSPTKEQDRFLPIANVSRIMKKSLPANAKISKEAKETVQGCVSEFINFVTGEASDKCQREKRKTINGDDLLWAMTTLGFENYVVPLRAYLSQYREIEGEKSHSVTRPGDQSPPQEPDHGAANFVGVNGANGNISGPAMGYMGLSSFNHDEGFYLQFPEEKSMMPHGDWTEL